MSDLPPDLPRLRTLEHWLVLSLDRVRRRIAEVETREAALRPVRQLPESPGWVLSFLRECGRPVADSVHIGDCRLAARHRTLSRHEARRALTDGGIRACEICRPPN
ncbi:DUF6233 domain-containing protein [Streptomyces sp. NBC_00233]|uniref:DUF6233 domain-containing protein n=1 Tax=Streptomyces sp. NBC_00233 TaxID=2975686 RepID=UPI0022513A48|nr:DUF6233 domain-containing protein [Streptomyces sp. NBC_00233]MCX5231427.1 DUF6233 domain-containing protein [Streptomyces sp. NBC_00233]